MSDVEDKDPKLHKHRHDVPGGPDHGAEETDATTKSIQGLLGASIVATIAVLAYVVLGVAANFWIY